MNEEYLTKKIDFNGTISYKPPYLENKIIKFNEKKSVWEYKTDKNIWCSIDINAIFPSTAIEHKE